VIRVVVDIAWSDAGAGWQVRPTLVAGDGTRSALGAPYDMPSFELDGARLPLPAAPPQVEDDQDVVLLCRGDLEAHRALSERLTLRAPAQGDAARYGRWLFECLAAPMWPQLLAVLEAAPRPAVELALRWPVTDTHLHALVWEAMRCPQGHPLGAHPDLTVAVTRLVPGTDAVAETITRLPRALFVSGTTLVDPTIRPGALFMGLLQSLTAQGRCRTRALHLASLQSLAATCAAFQPDLVQLVTHGVALPGGRVVLLFRGEDSSTEEQEIDESDLVTALTAGGARPLAVLLSACNTASTAFAPGPGRPDAKTLPVAPLAARLVANGIPIVTAMSGEVSERACRLYTRRLADALHSGTSVVEASAHGRRAALMGSPSSATEIDWALPTLYLAEGIDPNQRLVDDGLARRMVSIGNALGMRQDPVFVGRSDVLALADDMALKEVGVLAVLSTRSTDGLGGTRLLQEIAWRLLRDGHVPLLLGPYDTGGPATDRELLGAILQAEVNVLEKLGAVAPTPDTLLLDDALGPSAAPLAPAGTDALRRARIRAGIHRFAQSAASLDLGSARDTLADDLAAVGATAQQFGPPFGPHTRVTVLCHNVHSWGPPAVSPDAFARTGLGALLTLLDSTGLGRPAEPVPVIMTGSRTTAAGESLNQWAQNATDGFRVLDLTELLPDEAVMGFQWVLMHRWQAKADADPDLYGRIYTAQPANLASWEGALRRIGGRPAGITRDIFLVARTLAEVNIVNSDDDEGAWREYARHHLDGAP